jgi:succinate-semialdehyde dehydrogenase/glutarate-semialdehyde dehydrogenase
MRSVNPATGETIRDYPEHDAREVVARLDAAAAAAAGWGRTDPGTRARLLRSVAVRLRARATDHARLMTLEMGKLLSAAESEVEKCAVTCDWFAEHGGHLLAPEPAATDASASYVRFEPLGTVLAVMPWNFPFWQVFRCAAPALAAGNAVALKHASNVPGCALAIEEVFREAGLPAGTFTTLLVSSRTVPDLIAHPAIAAVSLTGSEEAGVEVARLAGAALKKCVLELGGSDAFVVLADADPERVAVEAVSARVINNGQSCIAAKRFIVEEPVAERFEAAFIHHMKGLVVGDPLAPGTQVGPGARGPGSDAPRPGGALGGGRCAAGRRGPAARAAGVLLRAHRAGRCRARDAGVRRGDLRPGGRRDPRARRRPRGGARQPLALRPRRLGVERGRGARGGGRGAARGRLRVRERSGQVRSASPLRRHQALGLRARTVRLRAARVRQHQDGVGALTAALHRLRRRIMYPCPSMSGA